MTWEKIESAHAKAGGRKRMLSWRVRCEKTRHTLVFPKERATHDFVDWFEDETGRVGFMFTDNGEFTVSRDVGGKRGTSRRFTIPSRLRHNLPRKPTDVSVVKEGDVWVVDLDAIRVPDDAH